MLASKNNSPIPLRTFGQTGLKVPILGFGAMHIGGHDQNDKEASYLLHQVLDLGVTLIDTARGYGLSEERIGKALSSRRSDFILSTKIGYGVEGHPDWTPSCLQAGIERALRQLKTDVIDIVHLHSCPQETFQQDEILQVLSKAKECGKVKVIAYSGENKDLEAALKIDLFGSIQTSVNICDQKTLQTHLATAQGRKVGIIAKRPLANAPWRFSECPHGHDGEEYWHRWQKMKIEAREGNFSEMALRFAAYQSGVHSCIVGTTNIKHLEKNIEALSLGALSEETLRYLQNTFTQHGDNWEGKI